MENLALLAFLFVIFVLAIGGVATDLSDSNAERHDRGDGR